MTKMKKILSLALALLITLNIFSVTASATDSNLADYSALTDYIAKNVPQNNDAGIYSAESYQEVSNILVTIDYQLSSENQETVDKYLSDLKTAVSGLEADESKAVAEFGLQTSSETVHAGDTVDVSITLDTNYGVISVGTVVIYDSTVFELVGDTSSISSVVDLSSSALSNYVLTGSCKNTDKIFASRNSNTGYWNTDEVKAQYKAINVGFSLNSKVANPAVVAGEIAKLQFTALSDVEAGTDGKIFISPDFNKTTSFAGGLTYASRSVGEKMGPVSSCITVGQTIVLDNADITVGVAHTEEEIPAVDATCTETGLTAGTKCSVCGEVLVAQEVVDALGHTEEEIPAVDATCTATGLTAGVKCSVCGEVLTAQEVVDALGHTAGEWVVVTPATCAEDGLKTKSCTVCGEVVETEAIVATGHTVVIDEAVAPKCMESGLEEGSHCSVCGKVLRAQTSIPPLGHTMVEVEAVEPTCTTTGLTAGLICSVCDEILEAQEVVDALGHTEEEIPAVDATCTETGLTAGVKCSVCGEVLTAQEVVDALGHTAGEATLETIDGVQVYVTRCTVCQEILETAEVGLADYTQLNALLEQANAIDVGNVYDMEQYEKMMAYIGNIDMNLPATQQSKVDNYVKTLTAYKMDRNLITYQLRTVNATATFEDGAVVLTVTEGKTQINLYQTAKNGDAITFNSTSGLSLSSSGVYYAKVNAIANITLANGKTVDVYFMIKDASEDVADYTAVDAAIEKAQAIVRDDVYDLETYDIMMEAVNKVQRGLPEREQATVTAYATEINAAYKNISLITSQLKVSYGKAEKFDDTIVCTLTRSDLSSRLLIYWSLRNGDEITFVRFGALRIAADGLRYATRTNTTAKIELKDGRQFLVLFVVKPLNENGYESVREQVERANAINTDDYYDMSEVNAFLNEINWDLSEETDIATINAYSVGLRDAIDRLRTIVSLLQTYNAPAVKDGDTITVTIIPGKSNVTIHPALKNGEPITITDLDGVIKASSGNYYSKYGGTATLTLQDGRSYNLVMDTNFVKEFTPQYVSLVNVDKYEYDADTQTFVLTANSSDIRIYKDAKAVALTVAADEYDFVSEYNLYYQIDSTKLHLADDSTARFTMESDDGKTINVVVIFPTLSILDFITMSNCSEKSFDAETNTAYIKLNPEATKRYVQIYNPALNGTEFTITSTSKYVQSNTSGYVLREAAVGADITIEFEGQTFTIVYTN